MDAIKHGDLVGTDKYGNKYYQNDFYFFGRNRWVEYNQTVFLDYDGSQVPAEWHNWLHYICDDPPTTNPRVHYKWMIEHGENLSGTDKAYTPYSTTPAKIKSWSPPGTQLKLTSNK
jgi:NADH:ubiquinone oxidoreductase subunit